MASKFKPFNYECLACGACCVGDGFAFLYPKDIERLAESLGITKDECVGKYLQAVEVEFDDGDKIKYLAIKKRRDASCVFLNEKKLCDVHESKPMQCALSPFIPEFLENPGALSAFAALCPGFGKGERRTAKFLRETNLAASLAQDEYEEIYSACNGSLKEIYGLSKPIRTAKKADGMSV